MARYRKRYSYRFRSYKRSSRRWRNFSKYNYNNIKVDSNFHIQYPSENGKPVIYYGQNVSAVQYGHGSIIGCNSSATYKATNGSLSGKITANVSHDFV